MEIFTDVGGTQAKRYAHSLKHVAPKPQTMKHPHRYLLLAALLAVACQPSPRTPPASTPLEPAYSDYDTLGPEEKAQLAH